MRRIFTWTAPSAHCLRRQAASRRRESRELGFRLAEYVNSHEIDLVLLAGDLFDSTGAFRETGEQLAAALRRMQAKVFVSPGNHDWYGPGQSLGHGPVAGQCPCIFNRPDDGCGLAGVEPDGARGGVHRTGAGCGSMLTGFVAPSDGRKYTWACSTGRWSPRRRDTIPSARQEIAASGLAYLALGHIHKRTEPQTSGDHSLCAWPGCPEGRGFDELGEKGFYEGTLRRTWAGFLDLCPLRPATL